MRSHTPIRRWAVRGSAAAFTAVALTAGMQAALTGGAQASPHQAANRVVNPYSPAYHHAYRHGVVPTIAAQHRMLRWDRNHPRNASANDLNYGGGIDGIGVTTGPARVQVYGRLAALTAPPPGVTRGGILQLDPHMLDLYWNAFGLGDISIWRFWEQSSSPNASPSPQFSGAKKQVLLNPSTK